MVFIVAQRVAALHRAKGAKAAAQLPEQSAAPAERRGKIGQRILCPADLPHIVKAQPAAGGIGGGVHGTGAVLCHQHAAGEPRVQPGSQRFEKLCCLPAVGAVVQRDGIHPQAVAPAHLQPERRRTEQKAAHRRAGQIKVQAAPVAGAGFK